MRILFKDVGKPVRQLIIPNELRVMQMLVGGYIEPVYLTAESALICNEEGKINDMKVNFRLNDNDWVFGPALFVGVDGEEFCSLSDEEVEHIKKCFEEETDVK